MVSIMAKGIFIHFWGHSLHIKVKNQFLHKTTITLCPFHTHQSISNIILLQHVNAHFSLICFPLWFMAFSYLLGAVHYMFHWKKSLFQQNYCYTVSSSYTSVYFWCNPIKAYELPFYPHMAPTLIYGIFIRCRGWQIKSIFAQNHRYARASAWSFSLWSCYSAWHRKK